MASCELPEELVIEEILTRLPVKSLMRFKCVCTFWCSLVESPSFISKHFERNNNNRIHDDDGSCSILVKHRRDVKDHFILLSYETLDVISEDLGFQSFRRGGDIPALVQEEILGCCNGVICMYNIHYHDIVLWNPATRQAKLIHESPIPHPKDSEPSCLEIGFGYDVVTNDYKVIRIAGFYFPHLHLPGVLRTEVYSLSTDSWRLIDAVVPDPASCMGSPYHRTCVNGIYSVWGTSVPLENDGDGSVVINEILISFDMSKEIFLLTPVPEFFDTEGNSCYKFFRALNESVALNYHG